MATESETMINENHLLISLGLQLKPTYLLSCQSKVKNDMRL